MKKYLIVCISILVGFTSVFAQDDESGNPSNWCRNGHFPSYKGDFYIAKIDANKGERVYFFNDDKEDCPTATSCKTKTYVIANDEILVSKSYGDFVCAWYQPKKGYETVGWLPKQKTIAVDTKASVFSDWLGEWTHYSNSITIKASKTEGNLIVDGDAVWQGSSNNIHTGEISDEAKPVGNTISVGDGETDEYACRASMKLLGKYLVVSDNNNCGGLNVTFSGIYKKLVPTKTKSGRKN